jgi:hypothetical protein
VRRGGSSFRFVVPVRRSGSSLRFVVAVRRDGGLAWRGSSGRFVVAVRRGGGLAWRGSSGRFVARFVGAVRRGGGLASRDSSGRRSRVARFVGAVHRYSLVIARLVEVLRRSGDLVITRFSRRLGFAAVRLRVSSFPRRFIDERLVGTWFVVTVRRYGSSLRRSRVARFVSGAVHRYSLVIARVVVVLRRCGDLVIARFLMPVRLRGGSSPRQFDSAAVHRRAHLIARFGSAAVHRRAARWYVVRRDAVRLRGGSSWRLVVAAISQWRGSPPW